MKLYGDYHVHSEFSGDASGTIDEIARVAKDKGMVEVAISDHGPRVPQGAKPKNYAQIKALCEKARTEHGIAVYFGIEANVVGTDGQIDVMDEYRRDFDLVLCGIHPKINRAGIGFWFSFILPNWFWSVFRKVPKGRRKKNTEIMKRAIERNDVDIWVHPNRFFKLDVVEVARSCADRGTLIELNGRAISFRPIDFERMLALGAKFVINSDAHNPTQIGRTDRIAEFLKSVEYKDTDIVNLVGTFKRGDARLLEKVQARFDADQKPEETKSKRELKAERKAERLLLKQKQKRERIIKSKGD